MAQAMGFYTDTTVCIGCKACQVACHEWNQLPAEHDGKTVLSGQSYDNTQALSAVNWRHVQFIEQFSPDRSQQRWLMMSDTCKHCVQAGCLDVCPTGAIIRTEFDTVYIQEDVCNGCRDCVAACPFGVIAMDEKTHVARKCTLCYDRLQADLTPACAQACPTASIQFGPIEELRKRADQRVATLQSLGRTQAYIYGKEDLLGGLNSFYLLEDKPSVYGLPDAPKLPTRNVAPSSLISAVGAGAVALVSLLTFRKRRMDDARADEDGR
jgi:formate dehydrogenase iron-sulfur subunit